MSYDDEPTQSMSLGDETPSQDDSNDILSGSFIDDDSFSDGPPKKLGRLLIPDSPPRKSCSPPRKRLRLNPPSPPTPTPWQPSFSESVSDEQPESQPPSVVQPLIAQPVQSFEDIYGPSFHDQAAKKTNPLKNWVFRMSRCMVVRRIPFCKPLRLAVTV